MKDTLIIFDTTLRDGEQSPGASMTGEEKLRIAKQLEHLRVDVIEAGFPAASPGDFLAVKTIADNVRESIICGLARANERDVTATGTAIEPALQKGARGGRIHTFIATSPIHMQHKLKMSPDQVIAAAIKAVTLAKTFTPDVEFSAEDAVRSDFEFLCTIFAEVIRAGATTINVPDTVGYSLPWAWGERMKQLIERVPGADKVVWSTHCHNDLGLAVANSLAAVAAGARQVECTINGLGERAGNASLEEIVMAVRTRNDLMHCTTNINTQEIVPTSKLVSQITGYPVQPNKAVVGANAFAHESGIHQDGVLKHRETYEIMKAEDVGWTTNRISLGKLSGRSAFRARLAELGLVLADDEAVNAAFARFKDLADKKRDIYDEDLIALISEDAHSRAKEKYQLVDMHYRADMNKAPTADITMQWEGKTHSLSCEGGGPVDAAFKAIEKIVNSGSKLLLFSVNAITTGTDAQGEVTVRLQHEGVVVNGQGADTDIVVASAKAYINALNRMAQQRERVNPQV